METVINFIVVDEDDRNIAIFQRLIPKIAPKCPTFFANDGEEGWELIKVHKENTIVLCGTSITKINHLKLIKLIRSQEELKDVFLFVVDPPDDNVQTLHLLQIGADDFITKPFNIEGIIAGLRNAVRIIKLNNKVAEETRKAEEIKAERDKDIETFRDVLIRIQELRLPESIEIRKTAVEASNWIAEKLGDVPEDKMAAMEFAANMCCLGRIYLNDENLRRPVMEDGHVKHETLKDIPLYAKELIEKISQKEEAANILYHIYENYDGSGIPEKIKGWQIPLGARILRIVLDYFDLMKKLNDAQSKAIEAIYHESKRLYDFKLVALFDQYLASHSFSRGRTREVPVSPKDLKEGMFVTRTVVTNAGLKILSNGIALNRELIEKIQAINKQDPVLGDIYIREV